jgi:ribosomal-protein-alanine N-acetyltransferase
MSGLNIILKSKRLILRVIDETYADKVVDYFKRNKEFLEGWEPKRKKEFYTLKYQRNQLLNDLTSMNEGNMLKLWIFPKSDDKIIGSIAFNNIVRGCFQSCYLSYRLDKDEVNKGYMTEALKESIDFLFKEFRLHRIEANIIPENKASLRVVEKLGFHKEGLAKKYLKINGKWKDHLRMVLLNEDVE